VPNCTSFSTKVPSSGSLLKTKDLSPTRTSGAIHPHFQHKGDSIIKKAVSQLYVQSGHSWQPASHVFVYIHWPYSNTHACVGM